MEIPTDQSIAGYYKSDIMEARASSDAQTIRISFPAFSSTIIQRVCRLSMLIDHCEIRYTPLIPINSTGKVRVLIFDTRVEGEDQLQAEYVFPVTCPIILHYYGTSYSSLNDDKCPWVAKYKLEDSNIKSGVNFCKIKAHMKLATAKVPDKVQFRSPRVHILSDLFTEEDVDMWHCNYAPKQPALCRSTSAIVRPSTNHLLIGPGTSLGQIRNAISEIGLGQLDDLSDRGSDPSPSASQVGYNISAEQLGHVLAQSISTVMSTNKAQPQSTFKFGVKPSM
mgnify:FL=1